jgi:hypothetical protein
MWLRAIVVAAILLSGIATAIAAFNMTGQYKTAGTTEAETSFLELTHTGSTLTGVITGYEKARLSGEAFADDSVRGTISFANGTNSAFTGSFDAAGLKLKIVGIGGQIFDVLLAPVGGPVSQPQPQPPAGDATYFYLAGGEQRGPISQMELAQLLTTAVLAPETMVWSNGMAQWEAANTRPEFAAALQTAEYYALEGGQQIGPLTLDALLARVRSGETGPDELVWKSGLTEWVRADTMAELAIAFPQPLPRPPSPPQPPTTVTDQTITLPSLTGGQLTPEELRKVTMALGATLGIFFHELGHALIGEIRIPATGPEEDTADELSSYLMGRMIRETPPEDAAFIREIAKYSTLLWKHISDDFKEQNLSVPWYDEHSDPANRFRNTLCLLYGADPEGFTTLANEVELPANTRGRCMNDFPRLDGAWESITAFARRVSPYDNPNYPGAQPADAPGSKITVTYSPSANGTGQALLPVFQQSGMFDGIAKALEEGFVWPRPFTVVFEDCGEANAYYDPNGARIRMCWEGLEYFIGSVLDAEQVPRH